MNGRTTEIVTVVPGLPESMKRTMASGRFMGRLAVDQIDDVAVAQMLLVGCRSGQHIHHRGVPEPLGDSEAYLRIVRRRTVFVCLVFGGRQIAGIGIERIEKSVERAGGHGGDVGRRNVVVLDLAQNLGIDAHLLVCGVLFVAGMNADAIRTGPEDN